jgi:alkanesulfonate monooxygenase SsuD/methylene tetrahydromethanopterin reductase-like flavin-dependent oxidoreductase (luciferase family)
MTGAPSVGVIFPAHAVVESLPSFAERAERVGLDELWVVEDCFLSGGVVMASTALAITHRLRVGIGLLPAVLRNPALAAMEISTLERLHPGRVTIAIGHGVAAWMRQSGAYPGNRLVALEEVVAAVRALLRGETVSVEGSHVRLAEVALERPPVAPPPILIGTTGPKGLAVAGRSADGILLAEGAGAPFVEWAAQRVAAEEGGLANPPRCVVYAWLRIDEDSGGVDEVLRAAIDHWRGSGHYPEPVRMAPANERELGVVGDPAACARAIDRLAAAGAHSVVLIPLGRDIEAQLDRLGAEVLPLIGGAAPVR